jgi:transcription initiation factor TFIIIB Brf1 subunit/transcription initiation factor TFIIB
VIVDDKGNEVRYVYVCPECGGDSFEVIGGFGGHETVVCKKCNTVVEERRRKSDV